MSRKVTALHTVHFADGTAKRPRRIDGRTVVDANGKVIEEDYTVVVAVPPNAVFVMTDEEDYKRLKSLKAIADAPEEAKVTFTFSAQNGEAPASRRKTRGTKAAEPASSDNEDLV